MIFVTVGTPDFDFSRLLKEVDRIADEIDEEVIIQRGQTEYKSKNCRSKKFWSEEKYQNFMDNARVIITHAGAGSIITCLNHGKKPVVVPRRKKHGEHQDYHQVEIARKFSEKYNLEWIEDIEELEGLLKTDKDFKFGGSKEKELVQTLKRHLNQIKS